jgi:16S rRNA (guanine527-N7)-methyltransferase
MESSDTEHLADAAARYELTISADQTERLEHYCRLLWEWNEKLNLTRHTDFDRFAARDLVDCLQLAELLHPGETILDVGSGGGVPGIVLAILRPELSISLCESVGKKAAALESIVQGLGLDIPVLHGRAEHLLEARRFDTLVTRAVGPLWKMLQWFEPCWGSIGRLLAIKGPRWVEERGEARHRGLMKTLELRKLASYPMPGAYGESVILQITPRS